jgi:hypothetical protein
VAGAVTAGSIYGILTKGRALVKGAGSPHALAVNLIMDRWTMFPAHRRIAHECWGCVAAWRCAVLSGTALKPSAY